MFIFEIKIFNYALTNALNLALIDFINGQKNILIRVDKQNGFLFPLYNAHQIVSLSRLYFWSPLYFIF